MNTRIFFWPISFMSAAAIVLNALLVLIIICRSVKIVGVYKFLLLSHTIVGLVQSLCEFYLLPIFFINPVGALYMSTTVRFSVVLGKVLTPLYSIGYVLWSLILAYSFLFRCMVLKGKEDLLFSKERGRLLLLFTAIITIFYGIMEYTAVPEKEMLMKVEKHIYDITGERIEDLSCVGGFFFKEDGTHGRGFFVWMAYVILIVPCLSCCIYCTYNFYSTKCRGRISAKTKALQNRLVLLLVLQTLIPTMFTYTPVVISYFIAIMSSDVTDEVKLSLSTLLPVAQLIDPIIVFIFVKEYHSFLSCCAPKHQTTVRSVSSGVAQ